MSTETKRNPVEYTNVELTEARKKIANVPVHVLENTIKIIEAAIQRNAFNRPDEMTLVGTNYDSLKNGFKMALDMTRKELQEAEEKKLETIEEGSENVSEEGSEDVSVPADVHVNEVSEVPPVVEIKEVSEESTTEFKVTSNLGF